MADSSKIEWTDATWNPVTGCSVVSPGCTNCYAMKLAGTRLAHHPSRAGLTVDSKAGPVWNGQVRFNEQWLDQPLRWRRPRMVFVCAHGDLFHESVPDEWIDKVFAIMALAPQHTFQVLTKRAGRMRAYCQRPGISEALWEAGDVMACDMRLSENHPADCYLRAGKNAAPWPLPNVWLGVSAEDQQRADERIPELLATPAAVRFASLEPLLGPVDLGRLGAEEVGGFPEADGRSGIDALNGRRHRYRVIRSGGLGAARKPRYSHGWNFEGTCNRLDWVIVGGESGKAARPMHPDWARSLRDQCTAAGVPFFFKQWGQWGPLEHSDAADEAGWQGRRDWMILSADGDLDIPDYRWPDEAAGETAVVRLGKARAGRSLDGREWSEMPA